MNVGLVREAAFTITDLTVVTGFNNSGKSTIAATLYAAIKAASSNELARGGLPGRAAGRGGVPVRRSIQAFLEKSFLDSPQGADPRRTLDRNVSAMVEEVLAAYADRFVFELQAGLGATVADLATRDSRGRRLPLKISIESSWWSLEIRGSGESFNHTAQVREVPAVEKILQDDAFLIDLLRAADRSEFGYAAFRLSQGLNSAVFESFPKAAHYLPAARAGLLQSHRLVAAAMFQRSPMVGLDELSMPALSGVVADFISEILLNPLNARRGRRRGNLADRIEKQVLGGSVVQTEGGSGYPEIEFHNALGKFPIHRTSSMVSELAPMVLLLRSAVSHGDLLIIEEPESHLHPSSQRRLLSLLFGACRDLPMFITTHSDYIVGQLNNEIRHEELDDAPDKVRTAAFWLDSGGTGSHLRSIDVNGYDGVHETSFADVSAQMYDEQVSQQMRLLEREGGDLA